MSLKILQILIFPFLSWGSYTRAQSSIRINEIMADPDPVVGLPLVEYVELFNSGTGTISLEGWTWSDEVNSSELNGELLPGGYLLLVPPATAKEFPEAHVLEVTPWPVLNNDGDQLTLRNNGKIIDQVLYSIAWHDSEKRTGGWSYERNEHDCTTDNWKSSADELGGTPGRMNSLPASPDNGRLPFMDYAFITPASLIKAVFSEAIPINKLTPGSIRVNNVPADSIYSGTTQDTIFIRSSNIQENDNSYELIMSDLEDCSGNKLDIQTTIERPVACEDAMVRINEVLFDPLPGSEDFIELINGGAQMAFLKGIRVSRYDLMNGQWNQTNTFTPPNIPEIINKGSLVFFSRDIEKVKNDFPLSFAENGYQTNIFNIPNNGAILILSAPGGELMDSVRIDPAFHHAWLTETSGYSLERINWQEDALSGTNWITSAKKATPGLSNSQYISGLDKSGISVQPEVIYPGTAGRSGQTIIQYKLDNPGLTAQVLILDLQGRTVRTLADYELISTSGQFLWNGLDNYGRQVATGYYLVWFRIINREGSIRHFKKRIIVGFKG